jgi:hypothetical protein
MAHQAQRHTKYSENCFCGRTSEIRSQIWTIEHRVIGALGGQAGTIKGLTWFCLILLNTARLAQGQDISSQKFMYNSVHIRLTLHAHASTSQIPDWDGLQTSGYVPLLWNLGSGWWICISRRSAIFRIDTALGMAVENCGFTQIQNWIRTLLSNPVVHGLYLKFA